MSRKDVEDDEEDNKPAGRTLPPRNTIIVTSALAGFAVLFVVLVFLGIILSNLRG